MGLCKRWRKWPCTSACTAMFRIPAEEVRHLCPKPLRLSVDENDLATIELGYVRFSAGAGYPDLPITEELAWGIAIQRERGFGMSFLAASIGADQTLFLQRNEALGFHVEHEPLQFETVHDPARTFVVRDARGAPICELRTQDEGGLVLPWLPGSTEVWTTRDGLARREFRLRGRARLHLQPKIASRIYDHPFFRGVKVSRAEPLAHLSFTSLPTAPGAAPPNSQWFTDGEPWRR